MRKWIPALCAATVLAGGAFAAGRAGLSWGRAHTAAQPPCGGEALNMGTATAAASSSPGGTGDAPGSPDGRPEEYAPNAASFQQLLEREGVSVRMSEFGTNFPHASPSQAANIALVARKLTGAVIAPGAVFSYNHRVGPFTAKGGFGWGRMFVGDRIVPTIGGGVCQGSSTLYNAVLLANLQVVERHAHGLTVPYLAPGRDATVTESGGLDFRFRNTSGGPVVLWAQAENRRLTIAVYGRQAPPKVDIETQVLSRTPFRTQVITDRQLAPGTERVAAAGQDGARSRTWVVIHEPGGVVRRSLGADSYRPSPRIILRGPAAPAGSSGASAGSRSSSASAGSRATSPTSSTSASSAQSRSSAPSSAASSAGASAGTASSST